MPTCNNLDINIEYSPIIKDKLIEKRKLRKQCKLTDALKTKLNRVIKTKIC